MERNINVWLPLVRPLQRTWPAPQACVLTGNRTSNSVVCRPVLNLLSHTSQGLFNIVFVTVLRDRNYYQYFTSKFSFREVT